MTETAAPYAEHEITGEHLPIDLRGPVAELSGRLEAVAAEKSPGLETVVKINEEQVSLGDASFEPSAEKGLIKFTREHKKELIVGTITVGALIGALAARRFIKRS